MIMEEVLRESSFLDFDDRTRVRIDSKTYLVIQVNVAHQDGVRRDPGVGAGRGDPVAE